MGDRMLSRMLSEAADANVSAARENKILDGELKRAKSLVKDKDKTRVANISLLAHSLAEKSYARGERWGGGGNITTYPKRHYSFIEKKLGVMDAKELRYFDRVYNAKMRWLTMVGA